jgi:hypothetical protein
MFSSKKASWMQKKKNIFHPLKLFFSQERGGSKKRAQEREKKSDLLTEFPMKTWRFLIQ